MEETLHYKLRKPAPEDFYDVADQNANMDAIDGALKALDILEAPEAGPVTAETEVYTRQDGAVKSMPALALLQVVSDPDSRPVGGKPAIVSTPALEPGGIDRGTGEPEESSSKVRTAGFVPVNPGMKLTVENGRKLTNVLSCYDGGKAPILNWYYSGGKYYSYKNVSDGGDVAVPANCAYVRVTLAATDTSVPLTLTSEASPAQFTVKKLYLPEGYGLQVDEFDDGLYELQAFASRGEYNIFTVGSPEEKPHEATLTLKLRGTPKFFDLSLMDYAENREGTVELVSQSRGEYRLAPVVVAFNDGSGAGRVRKLTVLPDAIPLRMTAEGLQVRRNNSFDNDWTEAETVTVNLAELQDLVRAHAEGLLQKADLVDGRVPVSQLPADVGLSLGETENTAYRGDRGKAAFDHISDGVKHITAAERAAWNGKLDAAQKGAANGVAPLGADGKVPDGYLNAQGGLVAQAAAPENTRLGWIDTSSGNILKFYDGAAWKAVNAVWG